MYTKTKLQNNLTLLTSPMPGAKSTTVMVMVAAGSRYETREINGLSHFLEHMAFKGTKKRPSAEAISREIDAIGGEFNAFTSKDHTAFYIKAASQHLDLMMDILSDMLTNSLFKEEEIEREKGVIIEEINMYEDTPMRKVAEVFENLMFGDTPMGWDIAGKAEIIRRIKREDFMAYVGSLYKTRNMVVSVAGGIEHEKELKNKVARYFGPLKDAQTKNFEKFGPTQKTPRLKIQFKKTEQAHLVLGFPSFSTDDPRKYALSVLTTILGAGMSSRLFIQVRERRGLAYYVHASSDAYKDCGDFTVSAGVDLKRIDEAIKTILEEIYKINKSQFSVFSSRLSDISSSVVSQSVLKTGKQKTDKLGSENRKQRTENRNYSGEITDSELRKAKEYLKGHLILGLEDSEAVAGLYASQFLLEEKVETPEEIITAIDRVTLGEVYAVADEIFNPKKVNLAVIGPFEDKKRFEKLINS